MDPISAVANAVTTIVGRVFPDPTQQAQVKEQLAQMYLSGELQQMTTQAGVITAEANSANKLASSWRPVLMYVFMVVIANNYIIAPYLEAMFGVHIVLPIPPDMWSLLKLGVGGYVVGRSIEKTATTVIGTTVGSVVKKAASDTIGNLYKGS